MSERLQTPENPTGDYGVSAEHHELHTEFPNLREIDIIKSRSSMHPNEDVQRRVLNTELLLYALRQVLPDINESSPAQKIIIKNIIDEIVNAMYRQDLEDHKVEQLIDQESLLAVLYSTLDQMLQADAIDISTHNLLCLVASKINLDSISTTS